MDTYYKQGVSFFKNDKFTEAIQCFKLSVINEPTYKIKATYHTGRCYLLSRNFTRAIDYFKQNVQYNCYDSIYQLAICYHAGLGVPKHYGKAFKYYKLCDTFNDDDDEIFDEEYHRCLCDLLHKIDAEFDKQNYVLAYELSCYAKRPKHILICEHLQMQYMLELTPYLHKDICNIVCDYLIKK